MGSGFNSRQGGPAAGLVSFKATRADAAPLQDFLAARLHLSRRAAKALIDSRSIWVNRRCVWIAHHAVRAGDIVEAPRAAAVQAHRTAASQARQGAPETRSHVRIILETPSYIVADKPAGFVSQGPGRSVEAILREQLSMPDLQAVHRLDRDTTGCLLFARTGEALLAAVETFKTHSVQKTYYAIVAGNFRHAHETIDAPLDGQPALSRVTRELATPDASFVRVRIDTGRTNQIRRHLASIRFPVIGDRTFGLKSARDPRLMAVPRQMLHAATLELPDPMERGGMIKAHSPLPADFRAALKAFGMGPRRR